MGKRGRLKFVCCCAALCALLIGCDDQISNMSAADNIKSPEEISAGVEEIEESDHNTVAKEIQSNYSVLRKKDEEIEKKEKELKTAEAELEQAKADLKARQEESRLANDVYQDIYTRHVDTKPPTATYQELLDAYDALVETNKKRIEAENNVKKKVNAVAAAQKNLDDARREASDYSIYHARLVNLLMLMDEADSGKHECPYHINGFHESVCVHVFDANFLKDDAEAMVGKNDDEEESISVSSAPDPDRGDEITTEVDSYSKFQDKIYNNSGNLFVTYSLPAFNEDKTPQIGSDGKRVYIDKQYSLEDDNQLNYLKYLRLSPLQYLDYFDYNSGKAKNVKPNQKLSDDARETAGYLPPLAFTGLSDTKIWEEYVSEFYSTKMAGDFSLASNTAVKKLMEIYDSLETPDIIPLRKSIGYAYNPLCGDHLYSYHLIAQPLIDHVGISKINEFQRLYPNEKMNIRNFVQYFRISKEKFIELTVDPGMDPSVNPNALSEAYLGKIAFKSDIAPYNADMVYEPDETKAMKYFSIK